MVLWFSAANRDPEVFEAPHEFRIDRTPNEHLTFGWGIHFCLGAHLARAEIRTFFGEVLRRGIRFEVMGEPTRVQHNIFRGWTQLPVRVGKA
ncbi:cytochrome P450 [Rhodococcus opacus]|uniref:cytochrome P450 n=1 Tax=Rhodococcus opacus TaxID=37919 RepID=UPI0034D2F834